MIYAEPALTTQDRDVLELIREQRGQLGGWAQSVPRRWFGSLRRNTFARAIQGSNTIEGYHATLDEAVAAVEEEPVDERTETWLAISGYRNAMTYILQTCDDQYFKLSEQFLKSLHFMMVGHDLNAHPGRWRPGSVYVVNKATGDVVYDAPDVSLVNELVAELVEYLTGQSQQSPIVTAAMSHLNLTMIHPFKDGNGRMARALQTLMLAQEGHIHPIFSSIEEWLGRNTEAYYSVLADVGQGSWSPSNSALPWIRFCLRAHYQQAGIVARRFNEYDRLFGEIDKIVSDHNLHDRMSIPLFDCALGLRMTSARYQKETGVAAHTATRDLKHLCDDALLEPHGERRGRFYTATRRLRDAREKTRERKNIPDPYSLLSSRSEEPRLPGL